MKILTSSFPLASHPWSLAALLGVPALSYLLICCAVLSSAISTSLFPWKKGWKTKRWKENSKIGTKFQTKCKVGNWSERIQGHKQGTCLLCRLPPHFPVNKADKPLCQARELYGSVCSQNEYRGTPGLGLSLCLCMCVVFQENLHYTFIFTTAKLFHSFCTVKEPSAGVISGYSP